MRLFVLAGGMGSRLKSAVSDVPKALAPIGDKPFLQLQIENWLLQGLREFTFLLHHEAGKIIGFLESQKERVSPECRIDWIIEPQPLDTGGAVAHAVEISDIKEHFLLTNADTWLSGGVREVVQATTTAMAVVHLGSIGRYGRVQFDSNNAVTAFTEKNGQTTSGWINAGLCNIDPAPFKNWHGKPFSLERDFFPSLVKKKELNVVPLATDFIDIGIPEDYYRFLRWVTEGRRGYL